MHVAHLGLVDFRSYAEVDLPLRPGTTVLLGANGQGKTNLVEGLGYLATLGSHRVATDAPLVRHGTDRAVVRAQVVRDGRSTLLEVEITPGRANRARVNRSVVPRAREVLGLLRVVVFAPEDLGLVKGDPGERRRFLDDLLVQRAPRLAGVRADYERVLKQRNALLRSAAGSLGRGRATRLAESRGDQEGVATSSGLPTLDVWDAHLARAGSDLLAARLDLVAALAPRVAEAYAAVAPPGAGAASLRYRASHRGQPAGSTDGLADGDGNGGRAEVGNTGAAAADRHAIAEELLAALAAARRQEVERGVTLVGPHRDELELRLGDLPARGYASHGESWSFALALRLASHGLLTDEGGEPVLVLDDVFAELDVGRRERLAALVAPAEQVLVTAAVPEDVPAALRAGGADVVRVESGTVTRDDT